MIDTAVKSLNWLITQVWHNATFHWLKLVRPCVVLKNVSIVMQLLFEKSLASHSINQLLFKIQVLHSLQTWGVSIEMKRMLAMLRQPKLVIAEIPGSMLFKVTLGMLHYHLELHPLAWWLCNIPQVSKTV